MTRKLVSISTLNFIHGETSLAIVGSIVQSLSDNFTMFPYLTRPIYQTSLKPVGGRNESRLMYYFKQFNESQSKAIPQYGDENNGHE